MNINDNETIMTNENDTNPAPTPPAGAEQLTAEELQAIRAEVETFERNRDYWQAVSLPPRVITAIENRRTLLAAFHSQAAELVSARGMYEMTRQSLDAAAGALHAVGAHNPDTAEGIKALAAELARVKELHNLQLAAISTVSIMNTEENFAKWKIGADHPCCTQAYLDVCGTINREMAERERAETAERELAITRQMIHEEDEDGPSVIDGGTEHKHICVHCGYEAPINTPEEELQAHVRACPNHPLRALEAKLVAAERERDRLQKENNALRTSFAIPAPRTVIGGLADLVFADPAPNASAAAVPSGVYGTVMIGAPQLEHRTPACTCSGIAPTMPVYRTEHLPGCPALALSPQPAAEVPKILGYLVTYANGSTSLHKSLHELPLTGVITRLIAHPDGLQIGEESGNG